MEKLQNWRLEGEEGDLAWIRKTKGRGSRERRSVVCGGTGGKSDGV